MPQDDCAPPPPPCPDTLTEQLDGLRTDIMLSGASRLKINQLVPRLRAASAAMRRFPQEVALDAADGIRQRVEFLQYEEVCKIFEG